NASIVGINVRNLKTLEVDTSHYGTLADQLPENVVRVAESGVKQASDVAMYASQGADAVLVGEALVKHGEPKQAIADFRQASRTYSPFDSPGTAMCRGHCFHYGKTFHEQSNGYPATRFPRTRRRLPAARRPLLR